MPRWTPEARDRQRQLIQNWQPWQHSTGPVTLEGKQASSQNARLKGERAEVRDVLENARAVLRWLKLREMERKLR